MTLSYFLRLGCLCFASFYVLHLALALPARVLAATRGRDASSQPARTSSRLIRLRVLPWLLAAGAVACVCLPCYFYWEPVTRGEQVGAGFVGFGALGVAILALSLWRSLRAAQELRSLRRASGACARPATLWRVRLPLLVFDSPQRFLVLAGLLRPRLIVSSAMLAALSPEQLKAAFDHELAHWRTHDNWKRWLWLAAPDLVPGFGGFARPEREWRRQREWAADDEAAASDPARALTLAEALLCAGTASAAVPLLASGLTEGGELAVRIQRLMSFGTRPAAPRHPHATAWIVGCAICATAALAAQPTVWHLAYRVLESFVH